MAGCADARVVDVTHTRLAQLLFKTGPEIHFVVAWPDGGTDERGAIGWIRAEFLPHGRHGASHDVGDGSFLARVHQGDGRSPAVDDEHRGAVGATDYQW